VLTGPCWRRRVSNGTALRLLAPGFSRYSFLQPSLNCPTLVAVKKKVTPEFEVLEGRCAGPEVCPLSQVKAGAVVCIRQLSTAPDVTSRLRELGICEDQQIRLVARQSNYICQVCNARLAISGKLADSIMVEAVPGPVPKE
jgi:Fe2+ transport system protein FeoA